MHLFSDLVERLGYFMAFGSFETVIDNVKSVVIKIGTRKAGWNRNCNLETKYIACAHTRLLPESGLSGGYFVCYARLSRLTD